MAWNVDEASYSSKTLNGSSEETNPYGLTFGDSGSKCYILGGANDQIHQYTLSTPWDLSTGSYASKQLSVATQAAQPLGLDISSDGTKVYISSNLDQVIYQYTLSTPWDISTGSYASKSLDVSGQVATNGPRGIRFGDSGSKLYVASESDATIYQYNLSTAWDVSTGSYASKSMSVSSQDSAPTGLDFSADGATCYVLGNTNDYVSQYTLSTPWDISTGSYASKQLDTDPETFNASDVYVRKDTGLTWYVLDATSDDVFQYDAPETTSPATLRTATIQPPRRSKVRREGRATRYGSRPGWPTTAAPTPLQIIETTRPKVVRNPIRPTALGGWAGRTKVIAAVDDTSVHLATVVRIEPRKRRRRHGHVISIAPRLIDYGPRSAELRGLYRVFNAAEYRFYRSSSGVPVPGVDSPYATASSLPATPSTTFGDGVWRIVVTYYNGIHESDPFVFSDGLTYRRLEVSSGAAVANPPHAPFDVQLEQRAGGVVAVLAAYDEEYASGLRGDTWVINATYDGSTPGEDPSSPTATQVLKPAGDGLAALDYELPAQAHGTTVKVRVQVRRGSGAPYAWSNDSEVLTTTADAQGPTAPAGGEHWRGSLPGADG